MARQRAPKGQGSIEQLPNGKWRVVVSGIDPVNGKRVKLSRTFDEQRQAVDFKAQADDMLKQKLLASAACLAADGDITLAAWLDTWLKVKEEKEKNTWSWYEARVRLQLKPVIGTVLLRDVSKPLVERFLLEMKLGGCQLKKKVSAYGQRSALRTLRAALEDAFDRDLIKSNPAKRVKLPEKKKKVVSELDWWTVEEAVQFLNHPLVSAHRLQPLFRLALDSGCRQGELLALRWDAIDLQARCVHVRYNLAQVRGEKLLKEPKSAAGRRTVQITQKTAELLNEYRETVRAEGGDVKAGIVFPNKGGDWMGDAALRKTFWRLVQRTGLRQIPPYHLRHSAASMWLRGGMSIVAVANRLGHESPDITLKFYAKCLPSDQGAIVELASRLLNV
jgi:integrase